MILSEGKTKIIRTGAVKNTVLLETKDVLTGGDAAKREVINDIGTYKTAQTTNIFSLLNKKGIPTAFIKRVDINELLCYECNMLPLEIVARRYAWGSYLQRHPEHKRDVPYRFKCPTWELFHKNTMVAFPITNEPYQIDEYTAREEFLHDGVWEKGVYTDPYIQIKNHEWFLYAPKLNVLKTKPIMKIEPVCTKEELHYITQTLLIPTFVILEKALAQVDTNCGGIELVDLKIEVGRRVDTGEIVIADVIDNDSWRIWVNGDPAKQLDKQCFRDGDPLVKVAENYAIVAGITERFVTDEK
jgi:phosphoribosylaminoimidazole-succinocarboxamide synthase